MIHEESVTESVWIEIFPTQSFAIFANQDTYIAAVAYGIIYEICFAAEKSHQ